METIRIQTGATERITSVALSAALAPLTGLTDLVIQIQRVSDGQWFDFSDLTFKAAGWTTRQLALTEISATLAPGQYRYDFVTSTITNPTANDAYLITVTQTPGTTVKNVPQVGELKVGQWVDNLNATVSSRSTLTQVQILSDVTPFQGARIDAAISSRAVAGDAMALTPAERLLVAGKVWDEALPGAHGAGSAGKIVGDDLDTTVSSRASAVALAVVQADTDDLQTRLPAALVGGRIDASVGAMATSVVTAAAIATDAIDADALAADAVVEIQAGLATSVALAVVQSDTDDIQARLPATLNTGRMRSHVEVMDTDVIGASQIAAGAIGSSEAPLLANLDATISSRATQAQILSDATPFLGARIDAAISSRAAPGAAMDLVTDAVDAAALAADAIAEIDSALSSAHGAGSWEGGTPAAIADAVWDEAKIGHVGVGSFGEEVQSHATQAEILSDATPFQGARIDATISSRATQAQILSDATPFQGARIDAAISSRAAPGAAMDLITDAVDANALAASAISEIDSALSAAHGAGSWEGGTPASVATAVWSEALPGVFPANSAGERLASTDDRVDARLPATLNAGRMRSHVEAMEVDTIGPAQIAAGAIGVSEAPLLANLDVAVSTRAAPGAAMDLIAGAVDAAAIATDAIDADALAADAIAEIQSGLATATAVASVQADTDNIQTRLPTTLVGGRMRSHVEVMDTDVIGAAQIAAGAIGTSEAPLLANLDTTVSSRAAPGAAMDLIPNAVDASALATDAIAEIDAALSAAHGSGAWGTVVVPSAIAAAVWDETLPGAHPANSAGERLATTDNRVDADVSTRASASALAAVQVDTDDIQTRLPTSLISGRMRSHVEAIGPGTITPVEAPSLANLDAAVSSRAVPGDAMDLVTDAVDASALAVSAVAEIDAALTAAHGSGSWGSPSGFTDVAMLDMFVLNGNLTALAWHEVNGQIGLTSLTCIVDFFSDNGVLLFTVSDSAPDAQGVFKLTNLVSGLNYRQIGYAVTSITISGPRTIKSVRVVSLGIDDRTPMTV